MIFYFVFAISRIYEFHWAGIVAFSLLQIDNKALELKRRVRFWSLETVQRM